MNYDDNCDMPFLFRHLSLRFVFPLTIGKYWFRTIIQFLDAQSTFRSMVNGRYISAEILDTTLIRNIFCPLYILLSFEFPLSSSFSLFWILIYL